MVQNVRGLRPAGLAGDSKLDTIQKLIHFGVGCMNLIIGGGYELGSNWRHCRGNWGAGGVSVTDLCRHSIRQNTQQIARTFEATKLAAFERCVESGNRIREWLVFHPNLAQLFLKGLESFTALDPSDKFRFSMLLRNIFSGIQGAYVRQLSVDHDPLGFEGQEHLVDSILANPDARQWLETSRPDWHPEFRKFVDARLVATKCRTEEPSSADSV